jgi:Fur family ferric uptake transcriptional regulator
MSETPFRKEVLGVFNNHSEAISIHVIEDELSSFNRITLYRTIKTFIEKGIIHEIVLPGHETKYARCKDKCTTDEHNHEHIHFSCTKCEKVICVDIAEVPKIKVPGFTINQLEIQAKGICENCS